MTSIWILVQKSGCQPGPYFEHPVKAFTKQADAATALRKACIEAAAAYSCTTITNGYYLAETELQ